MSDRAIDNPTQPTLVISLELTYDQFIRANETAKYMKVSLNAFIGAAVDNVESVTAIAPNPNEILITLTNEELEFMRGLVRAGGRPDDFVREAITNRIASWTRTSNRSSSEFT